VNDGLKLMLLMHVADSVMVLEEEIWWVALTRIM